MQRWLGWDGRSDRIIKWQLVYVCKVRHNCVYDYEL